MVNISMNGRQANITFQGEPKQVAFEIATAISGIFQGMKKNDQADATFFQFLMQRSMESGSPVWNTEHDMTMIVLPTNKSDTPTGQS